MSMLSRLADRGLIQFYYTPASRDAAAQIRVASGARSLHVFLRPSNGRRRRARQSTRRPKSYRMRSAARPPSTAISEALSTRWKELHDGKTDTDPGLRLVSKRFEEVVAHVQVMFQHGPAEIERGLDVLSDGQQSLFYFALAAAVFDLERKAMADKIKGFRPDELRIPALSLFGIEEPENHLSPYTCPASSPRCATL